MGARKLGSLRSFPKTTGRRWDLRLTLLWRRFRLSPVKEAVVLGGEQGGPDVQDQAGAHRSRMWANQSHTPSGERLRYFPDDSDLFVGSPVDDPSETGSPIHHFIALLAQNLLSLAASNAGSGKSIFHSRVPGRGFPGGGDYASVPPTDTPRRAHNPKVAGSDPAPATTKPRAMPGVFVGLACVVTRLIQWLEGFLMSLIRLRVI